LRKAVSTSIAVAVLMCALAASDQPHRAVVSAQDPEYPAIAAKMSLHGSVKLKVWIAPDGSVTRLEYIGGHPLLAESALRAVKAWKYKPAPKESTEVVEVKF
jgi:TonB family protein